MLRHRIINERERSFTSYGQKLDDRYISDTEPSEDDDNDSEFMRDIPYTSSSVDRSSIGSIPWADDAIKRNQIDWEHIERMLRGQEELTQEMELRNEILEWQRKFPNLVRTESFGIQESSDNDEHRPSIFSLDLHSISNLSLNSTQCDEDKYEQYDNGEATPTNLERKTNSFFPKVYAKAKVKRQSDVYIKTENQHIFQGKDICIKSVPIKLRQRYSDTGNINTSVNHQGKPSINSISISPKTPPQRLGQQHSPYDISLSASIVNNKRRDRQMRMPPILNIQESNGRFRDVETGYNRSFVQLTHTQQAKSAAVSTTQDRRSTIWRLPLETASLSSRYLNNRNTIILPSIHLEHAQESNSKDKVASLHYISSIPLGISYGGRAENEHMPITLSPQRRSFNRDTSNIIPKTISSTGRSISAAVHPQSRYDFNEFYVPYSASKFKVLQ